ncbi:MULTISPECIES: PPE domain-containing protein [Actinoalloteichus]|nr:MULTISPECIES: PPE domain-containing protein [Actinoalloteichus]
MLTDTQNWSAYNHRTLYEAVHTDNDPGQAGELSSEWSQMANEISESAQSMGDRLVAVEDGWTGSAARSARGAITQLADWSNEASVTAATVGTKIAAQAQVMEVARSAMPEPVDFDYEEMLTRGFATGGLAGFAVAVVDVERKSAEANLAHEQAVAVMSTMEEDSRSIDQETPQFTPPPNPVRGTMTAASNAPMGVMSGEGQLTPMQQGTPMDETASRLAPMQQSRVLEAPALDPQLAGGGVGEVPNIPGGPGGAPGMPGGPGSVPGAPGGVPGAPGGPGGIPNIPGGPGGPGGSTLGTNPQSPPNLAPAASMPDTAGYRPGGAGGTVGMNPGAIPNIPGGGAGGVGGVGGAMPGIGGVGSVGGIGTPPSVSPQNSPKISPQGMPDIPDIPGANRPGGTGSAPGSGTMPGIGGIGGGVPGATMPRPNQGGNSGGTGGRPATPQIPNIPGGSGSMPSIGSGTGGPGGRPATPQIPNIPGGSGSMPSIGSGTGGPGGRPATPQIPNIPGGSGSMPGIGGGGAGGAGGIGGGARGFGPGGIPNIPGGAGGGAGGFGGGAGGIGGGAAGLAAGGATGVGGSGGAGGRMGGMPGGMGGGVGAGGMGAGGMAGGGGAPARGAQDTEDKEHRVASYLKGEKVFERLGDDLPPAVIGDRKPKKQG